MHSELDTPTPTLTAGCGRARRAGGVDELAQSITGWQQTYDQTSPGRFHGELVELLLGPAQVFAESSSHALVQGCRTWPDAVWFGIPTPTAKPGRIEGVPLDGGTLAVGKGGHEFQLSTPDRFVFLGVVVSLDVLRGHAATCQADGLLDALDHFTLKLPEAALQGFAGFVHTLLAETAALPAGGLTSAVRRQVLDELFGALLAMLLHREPPPRATVSAQHARRTMHRARDFIEHHRDRSITVQELCVHLGASRRALQDCFQRSLDLSPKAYLRALALNAVRRELQASDARHHTVSDVATRHGFWHLSQFACDYRGMFGELPSETLRRSSAVVG